jgi:hypothetical protein
MKGNVDLMTSENNSGGLALRAVCCAVVCSLLAWLIPAAALRAASETALSRGAAASAAEKINAIEQGSLRSDPSPVRFSEGEANSYLEYELRSKFPAGLNQVRLQFTPGHIHGTAEIDFDKAKAAARGRANPVMEYLFFGVHTLDVEGGFSAIGGMGHFDLEKVSLDGVALPRQMVDYLIERFLLPRYPNLRLDQPFSLPHSIDLVQVLRQGVLVAGKSSDRA